MAELGLLRDHQGDEEPVLGCRAPPEGRGEPGGAPGGVGRPRRTREGPPGRDSGRVARRGANVAGFPGGRAVLRITDAKANNWLARTLRTALTHWRYRRRNPPPPQPEPPRKRPRR